MEVVMKSFVVIVLLFAVTANINSQTFSSSTLLYSYFDMADNNYLESGVLDIESPKSNNTDLYLQGGYKISSTIALAVHLNFRGDAFNFDESNAIIIAKYKLIDEDLKLSVGPYYEVTEGSIGIWSSYRQNILNNIGLTAKAALIYESKLFGKYYYIFGAGLSYPITNKLDFIGEGNYTSNYSYHSDFIMLSGGLSYNLYNEIHIRGALGYNILDTSPEIMMNINLRYLF